MFLCQLKFLKGHTATGWQVVFKLFTSSTFYLKQVVNWIRWSFHLPDSPWAHQPWERLSLSFPALAAQWTTSWQSPPGTARWQRGTDNLGGICFQNFPKCNFSLHYGGRPRHKGLFMHLTSTITTTYGKINDNFSTYLSFAITHSHWLCLLWSPLLCPYCYCTFINTVPSSLHLELVYLNFLCLGWSSHWSWLHSILSLSVSLSFLQEDTEVRASHVLGKHSSTELYRQPCFALFIMDTLDSNPSFSGEASQIYYLI